MAAELLMAILIAVIFIILTDRIWRLTLRVRDEFLHFVRRSRHQRQWSVHGR